MYLYLEPSFAEASEFDVVLNVAREVKNPFAIEDEKPGLLKQDAAVQVSLGNGNGFVSGRDSVSEPQTAVSEKSFDSALENQTGDGARSVPTTPKAATKRPEYIHIPWDHNTNVVDDLLSLCELIDQRTQNGKRVLVHCQCGVSRSASLVVAYGLYKNSSLSVQEAYNVVKDRSRWIGPNMNLIYQLSEFKSKLAKASRSTALGASNWHSWRALGSGRSISTTVLSPAPPSSRPPSAFRDGASLRKDPEPTPVRANSFSPPGSAQVVETKESDPVSPGPASAPPDMQWSPSEMPSRPEEEKENELAKWEPRPTFIPPPEKRSSVEPDSGGLLDTFQAADKASRNSHADLPP